MKSRLAIEPRGLLVWMIAIMAMVEALFQAIVAWHIRDAFETVLWMVAALVMFASARVIETLKVRVEAF